MVVNFQIFSIIPNNLPALWLLQNQVLTAVKRIVWVTDANVVKQSTPTYVKALHVKMVEMMRKKDLVYMEYHNSE